MRVSGVAVYGLLIASLSSVTFAANVSSLYVDDVTAQMDRSFEVSNDSDTTEYISLVVEKRVDTADGKVTTNAMTDLAQQEVLVSPAYFVLPPKSKQVVRITPLVDKGDEEKLYYVAVKPKLPPVKSEEMKLAVRMISAYKVLYLLRPKNPVVDYQLTAHKQEGIKLVNKGNTSILLNSIYACPAKDTPTKDCTPLQGQRVSPQSTRLIKHQQPSTQGFSIELQLAGSIKRLWLPLEN
ncbi:molecular chaperone [Agitococcus lubricus]|uniref:Pili/flagellar assembly PapD-like chaperone n=1 Tax=Agitococcus lubricus TaxID=1077255 RepID=A0A2T5J407_9GAMM|nr:fimbria/pilus periplasmic chaperone [Agitococcus lubricus]PTQ91332.1 pili/flagellar assembly PapD-like chaperone [Agitococcus lubricus]